MPNGCNDNRQANHAGECAEAVTWKTVNLEVEYSADDVPSHISDILTKHEA